MTAPEPHQRDTVADIIRRQQRFIGPLRLPERCSRCWMQEHCWNDRCPCDCAAWTATVDDLADVLDLDAGVADVLSRSGLDTPEETR